MKIIPSWLAMLAAAATLASASARALGAPSGPGSMRCTVVIGRLSSADSVQRLAVLSWVQGYLSGMASAGAARQATGVAEVPEYDALQPRILTLCKAEPTADLLQVANRFFPIPGRDR